MTTPPSIKGNQFIIVKGAQCALKATMMTPPSKKWVHFAFHGNDDDASEYKGEPIFYYKGGIICSKGDDDDASK